MDVDGVHFYTLNLERSATRILMNMGAIDIISSETVGPGTNYEARGESSPTTSTTAIDTIRASSERQFPWRASAMAERSKEEVRYVVGSDKSILLTS
jgi:hypothetical protein